MLIKKKCIWICPSLFLNQSLRSTFSFFVSSYLQILVLDPVYKEAPDKSGSLTMLLQGLTGPLLRGFCEHLCVNPFFLFTCWSACRSRLAGEAGGVESRTGASLTGFQVGPYLEGGVAWRNLSNSQTPNNQSCASTAKFINH